MPHFLLTVAVIWGVAAVTPGPNFFFVIRCALTRSRPMALAAVLGIVTGTLCWALAGWLGLSALFAAAPFAYAALKIAGSLYLIGLGLSVLLNLRRTQGEAEPAPGGPSGLLSAWRWGLITNLANPKTAIFVASLFSAALPPEAAWRDGILIITVMMGISTAWYIAVALMFGRASMVGSYRRCRRWIDAVAGMIFIGFGLKLALAER